MIPCHFSDAHSAFWFPGSRWGGKRFRVTRTGRVNLVSFKGGSIFNQPFLSPARLYFSMFFFFLIECELTRSLFSRKHLSSALVAVDRAIDYPPSAPNSLRYRSRRPLQSRAFSPLLHTQSEPRCEQLDASPRSPYHRRNLRGPRPEPITLVGHAAASPCGRGFKWRLGFKFSPLSHDPVAPDLYKKTRKSTSRLRRSMLAGAASKSWLTLTLYVSTNRKRILFFTVRC